MGSPPIFFTLKSATKIQLFNLRYNTVLIGGMLAVRLPVAVHERQIKDELSVKDELWMGALRET